MSADARAVAGLDNVDQHDQREPLLSRDFFFATTANLFVSLGQQMLLATIPVYVLQLGGTRAEAGLITGAAAITALIVRPFAGWLTDAWRRRPVVLIGCGGYLAASLLYMIATSVPMLALGRIGHGFALSNYSTAANAYIADIAPTRRRAEAIGLFSTTQDLGLITGPAIGFLIVGAFGFQQLFAISAAMAILALGCSLFARERRAVGAHVKRAAWSLRRGVISVEALPIAWIAVCLGLGIGPVNTYLSMYALSRGLDNPGLFFSVQAVFLLLSRTFAGRVADRHGRKIIMIPGLIAAAAALAVLPLATDPALFIVSAALWGLGFGCAQPASMALLVDRVRPQERGLAMSTYFMGFDIGIGLGAVALGSVSELYGWEVMWPCSAALVLLGLLGLISRRRLQPAD